MEIRLLNYSPKGGKRQYAFALYFEFGNLFFWHLEQMPVLLSRRILLPQSGQVNSLMQFKRIRAIASTNLLSRSKSATCSGKSFLISGVTIPSHPIFVKNGDRRIPELSQALEVDSQMIRLFRT